MPPSLPNPSPQIESPPAQTKSRLYENFPVVCWTIGIVSTIFLGIHWFVEQKTSSVYGHSMLNFILKELGFAGFIALILNLSIEWVNRKRHSSHQNALLEKLEVKHQQTSEKLLKDVNEHLFKTIYERNIDPSVFQQVEEHLLRAKVMRKDFVASFKIKPFTNPQTLAASRYVQISLVNRYRIFNLTDKPIQVDVAKVIVDVTPEFKSACFFKCVKLGEEVIESADLLKHGHVTPIPNRNLIYLHISRTVPPNDSLPVTIEYTKLAPLDYSEIVVTTIPMDGLTLEVSDPEEKFTVEAISLHPENETELTPSDQLHLRQWRIEHAILPGQGIVMMWHPNDVKALQNSEQSQPKLDAPR